MQSTLIILIILNLLCFSVTTARMHRQRFYGLRNVCTTMISHLFPENFCLYYLSDVQLSAEVPPLHHCLKDLDTSLVLLDAHKPPSYDKKIILCDGYLIVSGNYEMLVNLFDYSDGGDFEFQTHKHILLFYIGKDDFMTYPFNEVANLKGNEVIIIDALPNHQRDIGRYFSRYKNATVRGSGEEGTVRISSVRENTVLDVWDFLKGDFDGTKIKFVPWVPNFNNENDTFKIACFDCDPFFYLDDRNNVIDGIDYQIIRLMTEGWPTVFECHKSTPHDNSFGVILEKAATGKVDLAACSIWTKNPFQGVIFTQTYSESCYTFLVPKPHLTKRVFFVFHTMRPLVWCLTYLVAVIVAVLMKFSSKSQDCFNDITYALLQSIRILTAGPINRIPNKPHLILSLTLTGWFIVSLILTTIYSAGFSGVLTYPAYSEDMRTIRDMLKQNLRWGGSSYIHDQLLISGDAKLADNFLMEADISVRNIRIKTNKYAVAAKRVYPEYLTETQYLDDYARANLQVLQDCYSRNSFAFALRINSPYKKLLDKRLLRIIEHGLVDRWTSRILSKYNLLYMRQFFTRIKDNTNGYQSLNLVKMQGIFYFLILGYLCAVTIFIAEYYYDRYLKRVFLKRIKRK